MYCFFRCKSPLKSIRLFKDLFFIPNLQPLWQNVSPVMKIIFPSKKCFFPNFSIEFCLTTAIHKKQKTSKKIIFLALNKKIFGLEKAKLAEY